ncbi:MAG: sigma factor-like helix-turn-helix DNA-binding protein [Christensenellales bacterium]
MQALPQKYREVILLHYYQDLTAPEIAAILHQATGTDLSTS